MYNKAIGSHRQPLNTTHLFSYPILLTECLYDRLPFFPHTQNRTCRLAHCLKQWANGFLLSAKKQTAVLSTAVSNVIHINLQIF